MRLTVGPLPPAVYWRRRVFVLAAALLGVFLVAQACMAASAQPEGQEGGSDPSDEPSTPAAAASSGPPTSGPSSPPSAGDPTGEPAAAQLDEDICTDDELEVVAEAGRGEVESGDSVQFKIIIRNGSDRTCRRDVGGGQRELFLRQGSGATTMWSSRDCVDLTGEKEEELAPGVEREHWTVWNTRTSDECDDQDRASGARVDPGEYELVARVGTAYSEPVTVAVTD